MTREDPDMAKLTQEELTALVRSVFPTHPGGRELAVLVDVPRSAELDNPAWRERRALAASWARLLHAAAREIPLERVRLIAYADVGSNNADLPETAYLVDDLLPDLAGGLAAAGTAVTFESVFAEVQLFLAPTEYSTTAPLKNAARRHGFRAATMPGFSEAMLPALRLDYDEVSRRVLLLRDRLDPAAAAEVRFRVDGRDEHDMRFDLRFRKCHVSSGRFPEKGTAGNLPSGETYIVPYEGELEEPSQTEGVLPVQIGDEVVLFTVERNRVVLVEGEGEAARAERDHLRREPAYGNMAELGFGVLGELGLQPIGENLLDEKLGLHVAFGRSDHFGGIVGPAAFSSPTEVIHLDRIYIPAVQPRIAVASVVLEGEDGSRETIMEDGSYAVFL
jgi:hypothetical protein